MFKYLLIFNLLFSAFVLNAQTFEREYDFNPKGNESARHIVIDSQYIYLVSGSICDSISCLTVSKLDFNGEVFWTRTFDWMRRGNRDVMVLRNDSLFITGMDPSPTQNSTFHYLLLNTAGDSLSHHTYDYNSIAHNSLFNQGMVLNEDKILLYGAFKDTDTSYTGIIQSNSIEGGFLQNKVYQHPNTNWNQVRDIQLSKEKEYFVMLRSYAFQGLYQRVICRLNEDLELDTIWTSPDDGAVNNIVDEFKFNLDDNIIKANIAPGNTRNVAIHCLTKNGNVQWKYFLPQVNSEQGLVIRLSELYITKDNHVLGCGSYTKSFSFGETNGDLPYIFCLDSDGQLLWERYYVSFDFPSNNFKKKAIIDIHELPDGSILAVGEAQDEIVNSWIIRLDENGCLIEGQCEDQEHWLTSAEDVNAALNPIQTFPNPAHDILNINFKTSLSGVLTIFDMSGNVIIMQELNNKNRQNIDVSDLQEGVYLLSVRSRDPSLDMYSQKFLKF